MILVLVEGGPRNERRRLNLLVLGELNSRRESEQSKYNNTIRLKFEAFEGEVSLMYVRTLITNISKVITK